MMDFASLSLSDVKAVRKASAQHDLFNRLHSIAADERFVRTVSQDWYGGRFEVVGASRLPGHSVLSCMTDVLSQPEVWHLVLRSLGAWGLAVFPNCAKRALVKLEHIRLLQIDRWPH